MSNLKHDAIGIYGVIRNSISDSIIHFYEFFGLKLWSWNRWQYILVL